MRSLLLTILRRFTVFLSSIVLSISSFSQSGPGGVGNATGVGGVAKNILWLDASTLPLLNNDPVVTWTDITGNGNNATQAVPAQRPRFITSIVNGKPIVRFTSGNSNILNFNGSILTNTDLYVTYVAARRVDGYQLVLGGTESTANTNLHMGWNSTANLICNHWGNDIVVPNSGGSGSGLNSFGVFTDRLASLEPSPQRVLYQNGLQRGSVNNNNFLTSYGGAGIGSRNGIYYNVDVAEVVFYTNALNLAQMLIVNQYLASKYGITLDDGTNYYTNATYNRDVIGVGTTNGTIKQTQTNGSGGALYLKERNGSLNETNEFVFAGNSGTSHGVVATDLPTLTAPAQLLDRWNRVYYIERRQGGVQNAGTTDLSIGFDFTESGIAPADGNVYYLLYRAGTSGTFSTVVGGTGTITGGKVWFNILNANLTSGYYTVAKSNQTNVTWYSYPNPTDQNWDNPNVWTLDPSGTLLINPSNLTPTTSPTALVDKVVILPTHRVNVITNNKQNTSIEVMNSGILDLGSSIGHVFNEIKGSGTIRTSADVFPSGDASGFTNAGLGTLEYYGTSYSITNNRTFNNVILNLNNATDSLTLLQNFSTNGDLKITRGKLRINDDASTTILNLRVAGDVSVSAIGKIGVGHGNTIGTYTMPGTMPALGLYSSIYHQVVISGSLTNYGTIRFTNQGAPNYSQFTTTGAANVTFTGSADSRMDLFGKTDFYNLIIDKGIDKTFTLELYSDNIGCFHLFGPSAAGRLQGALYPAENPEIRKSLWIKTGTLKLTGSIYIPSLAEGAIGGNGDYAIPANGALWIAGPDVKVYTTARTGSANLIPGTTGMDDGSSNQALSVYGLYKITGGFFSTRNSAGFIFWPAASAEVQIAGGITDVSQFRSANGAPGGKTSFSMTGGHLYVRGNEIVIHNQGLPDQLTLDPEGLGEIDGTYPLMGIIDPEGVFNMSGGTIHINDVSTATNNNAYSCGGIYINSKAGNFAVIGGTTEVKINGNAELSLYSTANLYNLTLTRLNAVNTASIALISPIKLGGALTLNSNTQLSTKRDPLDYNNLEIGGSFILNTLSAYISGENTTTFSGTGSSAIFLAGTVTGFFHNLTFKSGTYTLSAAAGINTVRVMKDLTVMSGATLNISAGKEIIVRGDISNSGTIGGTGKVRITEGGIVTGITVTAGGSYTAIPTVTITAPAIAGGVTATAVPVFSGVPAPGNALPITAIRLTNTGWNYNGTQAITVTIGGAGGATTTVTRSIVHNLGGDDNGKFGNLELDQATIPAATISTQTTYLSANQTVTGTLTLTTGILDIKAFGLQLNGSLSSELETSYSESKMIRMTGNHSDLGVTRFISANGTYLYPVGTYNSTAVANRYCWAKPSFTAVPVGGGYVQINAVPKKLPTLAISTPDRYLTYYWRIRQSGFSSTPNILNQFLSYEADYTWTGSFNNYLIGKVVNNIRYGDGNGAADLGTLDNPSAGLQLLNFSVIKPLETGEYTCAFNPYYNGSVRIFYLFTDGGDWRTPATWSTTRGIAGNTYGDYPQAGDIAVIRRTTPGTYSGIVQIKNAEACAKVTFDAEGAWASGCPRIEFTNAASFGSTFDIVDVAPTHSGGTLDGETHGAVVKYDLFAGYAGQFPVGDFGSFYQYPNALVIYRTAGAVSPVTLSSQATEYPQVWFDPPNAQQFVLPPVDVTFHGLVIITYDHQLRLNTGGGNAIFEKRLDIGHPFGSGRFNFQGSSTTSQTVTVTKDIRLINSASQINILNTAGTPTTHNLIALSNISMESGCSINLGDGNAANAQVNLDLQGATNNTFTGAGTATAALSTIKMNKGTGQVNTFSFDWGFTLNGATNGATKAITLQNGNLLLNNAAININLNTGGADFIIPSTAGLTIKNGSIANVTGSPAGIYLDGLLEVDGGTLNMDGGAGADNYILYSSSGNATLNVKAGTLTVGSQVRSNTLNELGTLKYTQSGGTVVVGKNSAPQLTRPIFEIRNGGSRFIHQAGSFTIVRSRNSASMADLYLYPSLYFIGSTTVNIGNASTPVGSIIDIQTSCPLQNLTISTTNSPTARLKVKSLTLNGNLTINPGATFDGNGLNLTVLGNIINNGSSVFNTDTLFLAGLTGVNQSVTGSLTLFNVEVKPVTSVTLGAGTTMYINRNLHLMSGTFNDGGNTVTVYGDVSNDATHFSNSSSAGGIKFAAASLQNLYNNGTFGRIEIDNASEVRLHGNLIMDNDLTLNNGVFSINQNLLSLETGADIIGSGFGPTKMIATDGVLENKGLRKAIATGVSTFTFPIGTLTGSLKKYTPVDLNVTSNSTAGYVTINPVNQKHMTISATNVLQYYWHIVNTGLSGFTGTSRFYYLPEDVVGDEAQYISARLVDDSWSKLTTDYVDEVAHNFYLDYTGVNDISGDYTAGLSSDIPDVVPLFISNGTGNWTDETKWIRFGGGSVPAGGPYGHRVQIRDGDIITIDQNRRVNYKTTILGRLDVALTFGHNFGEVDGTGTLAVGSNALPAGRFENFFTCSGGTMEYGGPGSYTITDRYTTFRNLIITGSGVKQLPDHNIFICKDLTMDGTATLKLFHYSNGASYKYLTVNGDILVKTGAGFDFDDYEYVKLYGNIQKQAGCTFNTSYTNQRFDFLGSLAQGITGTFTGTSGFNNLYINNPTEVTLNGPVDINAYFYPENGSIISTAANLPSVTRNVGNGLYYPASYHGVVEGPFNAFMKSTSPYQFLPVGKNKVKKQIGLFSLPVTGYYWKGEYFNTTPLSAGMNPATKTAPLQTVSELEYWTLQGQSSSGFSLPITNTSDICQGVTNINNLRIANWNGASWVEVPSAPSAGSTKSSGTIETSSTFAFTFGVKYYFTIASTEVINITSAQFNTPNQTVCVGTSVSLQLVFTGTGPWTVVLGDGSTYTTNTSPLNITKTPAVTTTYFISTLNGGTGMILGNPVIITVKQKPTVYNVGGGGIICGSQKTSVTLSSSQTDFYYELYRNGVPTGNMLSGIDGNPLSFNDIVVGGVYSIRGYGFGAPSCDLDMNGSVTVTNRTFPTANISGLATVTPMCEGGAVQIDIVLNGTPNFNFTISDNHTNSWNVAGINIVSGNTYAYTIPTPPTWIGPVPTPTTYTYSVSNITDNSGCGVGTTSGSASVAVYALPRTGPTYHVPNSFGL